MRLEYLYYKLDKPRYTPDECKELRLTYGRPFRIGVRFVREGVSEIPEEEIYLGEIPIMLGGGEFIVNGAERCIVSQLHRSPGVDFGITQDLGDRPLHHAASRVDALGYTLSSAEAQAVLALPELASLSRLSVDGRQSW